MLISDSVKELLQNDKELFRCAIKTLLKIANNILNNPNEAKFRSINLNTEVMERSLIPAIGALEILFLMGFEEGTDRLILKPNAPLDEVTLYRDQLEQLKRENIPDEPSPVVRKASTTSKRKQKVLSDYDIAQFIASEADVKREIEHHFQQVLLFESPRLQEEARSVIPVQALTKQARELEVAFKEKNPNGILDLQDCILIKLSAWFKEDFYSWFDQGFCEPCGTPMKPLGQIAPNEEELKFDGHRVEFYQCEKCSRTVRFPRYFHPGKLLQTRKGRCMEWASCFTLMCRALGFDSRYVWDQTDHVWAEVYSVHQNRWVHADPCENKLDSCLMYDKGWNKKLSYIFAFSKDEVVDCVWRYSADHAGVCGRRNRCREDWLATLLCSLNRERQQSFPEAKKKFLEQRLVREIAEFFAEPKILKEGECEGRSSGSLSWRQSRGETEEAFEPFVFVVSEQEVREKEIKLKYSPSLDVYIRETSVGKETIRGCKRGMFSAKNVFRKHEKDWKLVYVARTEGSIEGEIQWRFDWAGTSLKATSVTVELQHETFEDGVVHWQICVGDSCFQGNRSGLLELSEEDLEGSSTQLEVSAALMKGKGDVAWQHAQLFRQKQDSAEFPFRVIIKFA